MHKKHKGEGPIRAHHMPKHKGHDPVAHPAHAKHNKAEGLPADMHAGADMEYEANGANNENECHKD